MLCVAEWCCLELYEHKVYQREGLSGGLNIF